MSDNYFEEYSQKESDEYKLNSDPSYYIRILEQTEENCALAVSLRFDALKHIPKSLHTYELCLTAVKQCGYALKYVSKKIITEELSLEAVKSGNVESEYVYGDYNVFDYIPKKYITLEFCNKSYEINPDIYKYIPVEYRRQLNSKDMTKINASEWLVERLDNDGLYLKNIPPRNITASLCFRAVENNPFALEFVPDQLKTIELCELALENDLRSIVYFPQLFLTLEFVKEWLEDIIYVLELEKVEDEKEYNKVMAESYYNDSVNEMKYIISRFPENINSNNEIIILQRKLGVRKFISKVYDVKSKKFVTVEKILDNFETEEKQFSKFMQFYNYVDCDLNNAYLYDFDFKGIDLKDISIEGAYISSKVLIEQDLYDNTYHNSIIPMDTALITPLMVIENETIDAKSLIHINDIESTKLNDQDIKFYYISDIHLMHKITKKFPSHATDKEIAEYIKSIVYDLKSSAEEMSFHDYLLIGGDISFNFEVSKLFYAELSEQFKYNKIIAILGNHELWDAQVNNKDNKLEYSTDNLDETISKYRIMFKEFKIHFLHNQMMVLEDGELRISTEDQLLNISEEKLKNIALKSPFVLLGGLGFSGYEEMYNATGGLYRNKIITLDEDLIETKKIEKIYSKVKRYIPNEKVIVFTHTPKSNWSKDGYNSNWIYINGHTHKNEYTIDSKKMIYSDNQIGYKSTSFGLKFFNISGTYDVFKYYSDGKYVIKRELYNEFNRGMKIQSTCNRATGIIHMLKKYNNYCFFYENNNRLYLLNGGAIKKAEHQNLNYYFDRLDIYSNAIKKMLITYNKALKEISNEVKKIGGNGNIHGCIVDIDYLNHIYLNPIDGSITPYFATDIINKEVYPSVKMLLKDKNHSLYNSYMKMISNNNSILALRVVDSSIDKKTVRYVFDTSMYEPSRVMKSLQYITEANVIRNWNDDIISKIGIDLSNKQFNIQE